VEAGEFEEGSALLAVAEAGQLDDIQRAQVVVIRGNCKAAAGDAGDLPEAVLYLAARLETVDAGLSRLLYLSALAAAIFAGSLARGAGLQEVAKAAAAAPTVEPRRLCDVLLDGFALLYTEGPGAAASTLVQAATGYDSEGVANTPDFDLQHLSQATATGAVLWEFDTFKSLSSRFVQMARDGGFLRQLPMALNHLAAAHLYEGDFPAAAALIEEADVVRDVTNSTSPPYFAPYLAALRGRGTEASKAVQVAVGEALAHAQGVRLVKAYWASATLHNGLGQYAEALAAGSEAMRLTRDATSHLVFHELVEAASRSGRRDVALDVLEQLSTTMAGSESDWALGIKARSEALVQTGVSAEALYLEAIERLARTPLRPELARAHLLYGEWLRREGRRVDARQNLRGAYEQLSAIGMDAFAERARRELAATGETVRRRTVETLTDLTPQELQVARLAGEGHSNPEIGAQLFISARTVEYHLRKVFTKLAVTSRKELRQRLAQSGSTAA
jgi:DNA-binding CsgD family transcriptional regulator/tetratricopeptide (TPR) repeat protein